MEKILALAKQIVRLSWESNSGESTWELTLYEGQSNSHAETDGSPGKSWVTNNTNGDTNANADDDVRRPSLG